MITFDKNNVDVDRAIFELLDGEGVILIKNVFSESQIKEARDVINKISSICADHAILKIGQNIKYDLRILNKYNISINSVADTMLMSYVLDNGLIKHNMDDLAFNHLQHNTIKFKEIVGSGKNEITFDFEFW